LVGIARRLDRDAAEIEPGRQRQRADLGDDHVAEMGEEVHHAGAYRS
jgi:hypothetical protein